MKAGLMKYFCDVYRYVDVTSDSGMRSRVRQDVARIRCQLVKEKGYHAETDTQTYDSVTIYLETWKDLRIKDTDLLCFCGQEFRIVLIDYTAVDRTMKLTCKKTVK